MARRPIANPNPGQQLHFRKSISQYTSLHNCTTSHFVDNLASQQGISFFFFHPASPRTTRILVRFHEQYYNDSIFWKARSFVTSRRTDSLGIGRESLRSSTLPMARPSGRRSNVQSDRIFELGVAGR